MAKRNRQKVREARRQRIQEEGTIPTPERVAVAVDMTDQPWLNVAYFSTFELADAKRTQLIEQNGDQLSVKIKKMNKPEDKPFVVKTRSKVHYV